MATLAEITFENECRSKDTKTRAAGFLTLRSGEVYERQYSHSSHVFLIMESAKWSAWRETWQQGKSKSISHKLIISSASFDMALLKARQYIEYVTGGGKR